MTNGLPYYGDNYDDPYYIGKVVHQVGASQLMMKNYFNGSVSVVTDISRLINTFELTYGFFGDLFNISLTFFCRGTMVIHNYMIVFFIFKLYAEEFVEEVYSQFIITPMLLLLVPSGYFLYSDNAFMRITMYDGWQFQTAIFYGGSMVRVIAIPVILIYGKDLIAKLDVRKVIFIGILYLTLISFSTIFLTHAIMLCIAFIIVKWIYYYQIQNEIESNKKWLGLLGLVATITLLLILNNVLGNIFVNNQAILDYDAFINKYFWPDFFIRYGLFVMIPAYYISNQKEVKMVVLVTLLLYLSVYTNQFIELLLTSSLNMNFVLFRFITSICFMIIGFIGIFIARMYSKFKMPFAFTAIASLTLTFGIVIFMYSNKDYIKEDTSLSTGISQFGYSINQLLDNDRLIPDIMIEVGQYFDSLEYGSYRLISPYNVPYNGRLVHGRNFVMVSNNIETCFNGGCNNMTENQLSNVDKFFNNQLSYLEIKKITELHQIDYMLVVEKGQKEELENSGFTVILSSLEENKEYYLLQR